MSRTLSLALIALVLSGSDSSAVAQERADQLTGTRVRLTAPHFIDHRVTGVVDSWDHRRITIREEETGRRYTVPLQAVSRIDPFKGNSPSSTAWYRGRFGAFLGAAVGGMMAPMVAKVTDQPVGQWLVIGGLGGAAIGGAAGAVYGWRNPQERWSWLIDPWGYDPELRPGQRASGGR